MRFAGDKLHKKAGSRGQHLNDDSQADDALLHNQGRSGGRNSMLVAPQTRSGSVTVHPPLNRRFQPIASDI